MMKSKLIIIILIVLYSISCFASHITIDQQKVFSELDRLSSDLESDDIWALYIRKFGNEKVMIRFPKSPKLKCLSDNENSYCIEANNENTSYQLFVHKVDSLQAEPVITKLQKISDDKKLSYYSNKPNKNFLDISYYENKDDKVLWNRVIVTKENVFKLVAEHQKSAKISDEYFLSSFDILNS